MNSIMKDVFINKGSLAEMISHLEESYPLEGVGFLYGIDKERREITAVLPVKNSAPVNQREKFEVAPLDYLRAEQHAEESGLTLLGIYHSHPDHKAYPSVHDRNSAVPMFSYIIVSVKHGEADEVTSWQLNQNEEFEQEKVIKEKIEYKLT